MTPRLRFHPIEIVLLVGMKIGAVLALGVPAVAVIVFEVALNATSMFTHSNVALPGLLERLARLLIVIPQMHEVHHSAERPETDSNYVVGPAVRDISRKPAVGEDVVIGLAGFRKTDECRIARLLTQPFRNEPYPAAIKVASGASKVKSRFLLPGAIEAIRHDRSIREVVMRKTLTAIIVAIALYFALAWGYAGLQAFKSSLFGLEDVWNSHTIFVLGHMFNFGPVGLVKLAAFLAVVKLVAAAFCGLHAIDRARGRPRTELLEGALIIAAAIAAAGCASAMWSQSNELFREFTMQFALAAVGIALCVIERRALHREDRTGSGVYSSL